MRDYSHDNIVKFHGVVAKGEPILVVMELVTGGGLDSYLKKHGDAVSKAELLLFCLDAASGLAYLHTQQPPLIHRDIAARNCLIQVGQPGAQVRQDWGLWPVAQGEHLQNELEDQHVLFMTDDRDHYIDKLFNRLRSVVNKG